VRWVLAVLLCVAWARSARGADPPDQSPAWSIRVDWPRQALIGLTSPPNPDSLEAPVITMLRNEYAARGGFPLGGVSLKTTFQLQEDAGHVSIGVIDLPTHFQDEGHVSRLGTPIVYREVHELQRRNVQILENYAYYQDVKGAYLCRSFLNGDVVTLDVRGTVLGYSGDRSHALTMATGAGAAKGLTFFYYDISNPPRPRLLWSKNIPDALPAWQCMSLSDDGGLVAIQYLDGILKLSVFDAHGELRLRHSHGPDEGSSFGLEFISPTELLEGFDPRASYQDTQGLSLYRIRS
jgi:hypothetical protein